MANKRIIQSAIFEDEFFGTLSFFERLLWIGIFTRCADDQGRTLDNPIVIRSQVFPYDDIPASDIDKGLETFTKAGKIIRYSVGFKKYIQIVKWFDNQQPQWAMPSKYPAPPNWKDRIRSYIKGVYNCENWPEKVTRQAATPADSPPEPEHPGHLDCPPGQSTLPPHVAGHEINPNPILNPILNPNPNPENRTVVVNGEQSAAAAVSIAYEENIGLITPMIADELRALTDDYPAEWTVDAIKEAAKNNVRKMSYILAILKNWQANGRTNGAGKKKADTQAKDYVGGQYAEFIDH